jgi:hypothetical protein
MAKKLGTLKIKRLFLGTDSGKRGTEVVASGAELNRSKISGTPVQVAVAAAGLVTFTDNITQGEIITIGHDTYEIDIDAAGVTAGNFPIITTSGSIAKEDSDGNFATAVTLNDTMGVGPTDNADGTVTLTADTKGAAGNDIALKVIGAAHIAIDADTLGTAVAGVDGTAALAGGTYYDSDSLYIASADNTTADSSNWYRHLINDGDIVVSITAATESLTKAEHAGRIVTLDKVDGIDLILPEATGSGDVYKIVVGTALTSDTITITAADTTNCDYVGHATGIDLDDSTVAYPFNSIQATGNDIYTMNMTDTGGINIGTDWVSFTDIKTDLWLVDGHYMVPTGSNPATPFSSTV